MSRDAVKPLFYLPRSSRVTDFHSGLVTRSDIVGRARIRSSENLENCWNRKIRLDSSALKLHPFNIVSNRWTDISNKSSLPQVQSFLSIDTDRNKKKREKNLLVYSLISIRKMVENRNRTRHDGGRANFANLSPSEFTLADAFIDGTRVIRRRLSRLPARISLSP